MGSIRTEIDGSVGTVIIDNPERRNAMTADMYAAVPDAVESILSDPATRAVILRGAGDEAFGAGSDISEFSDRRIGEAAGSYDAAEHLAWRALAGIPLPVIAAIHGPCMGGGIAMALHADIRLAAEDATFSVPPARLGIAFPHEAVERLVRLVGPAHAKLLLYTAEVIDAEQAREIGLVQEVVTKTQLDDRVADLARAIGGLAPLTQRAAKLSVDALYDEALTDDAATARRHCYDSADFREGVAAFMEKRKPRFEGR